MSEEETLCFLTCLREWGCGETLAAQFLSYQQQNRVKDQIRLLNKLRQNYMVDLHAAQNKVDCIDFVIRQLEQTLPRK